MTNLYEQLYQNAEKKLSVAVGHLGSYDALIQYAIQALEGKTATPPDGVAKFILKRHEELVVEQNTFIFNRTQTV